jgi:hypothetical protein
MTRCAPFAAVILGAIGFAASVSAQEPTPSPAPGLAPGARIRVSAVGLTTPTTPTTRSGTVAWVRGDTIAFRPDGVRQDTVPLMAVPMGHIERLDVSRGLHRHTLAGLGLGALGGALLGAGFGAVQESRSNDPYPIGGVRDWEIGAGLGVGAGLVLGTVIGTLIDTERWARVSGYAVGRMSVVPLPHGIGLGYELALRF